MPSHQNDLWDHAILLFYNYEWQGATELFSVLSTCIASIKERQRCSINEGLLHARMGDMLMARKALHNALELDVPSIILRCALAEVEAKLGNLRQAHFWYESCLMVYTGHLRADESYYFGYCPTQDDLRANLKALSTSTGVKHDFANSGIGFERIPAECIFFPSTSIRDSNLSMLSRLESPLTTSTTERPVVDRHTVGELSTVPEDDELESLGGQSGKSRSTGSFGKPYTDRRKQPQKVSAGRPRVKLEARDARSRSESLKELADFLRNAGPAGNQQYLVDHKYMMNLLDKAGMGVKHEMQDQSTYEELMGDVLTRA